MANEKLYDINLFDSFDYASSLPDGWSIYHIVTSNAMDSIYLDSPTDDDGRYVEMAAGALLRKKYGASAPRIIGIEDVTELYRFDIDAHTHHGRITLQGEALPCVAEGGEWVEMSGAELYSWSGWGVGIDEEAPAYNWTTIVGGERFSVFVGLEEADRGGFSDPARWCCEIEHETNGLYACAYHRATPAEAVRAAFCDWSAQGVGDDPRERNAEDATNVCAYEAAALMVGRGYGEMSDEEREEVGALYGIARSTMRELFGWRGWEWVDF